MIELKQTEVFRRWRTGLKDGRVRGLIASRLDRLAFGNPGDVKPVGQGVSELRIDYGPGYRLYFKQRGKEIIVLLCGGEKKTQERDIRTAKRLAEGWNEDGDRKTDKL
jgi:putative addiction module killer protein